MFTVGAISLNDGVRSMSVVANETGRATGVDPAMLLDQLRAFFRQAAVRLRNRPTRALTDNVTRASTPSLI